MLAGPMLQARLLFKFSRTHDPARVRPPGEYSSYSNYGADATYSYYQRWCYGVISRC